MHVYRFIFFKLNHSIAKNKHIYEKSVCLIFKISIVKLEECFNVSVFFENIVFEITTEGRNGETKR